MVDPLRLLERTDKYYLGSGTGLLFAPRFPCWLEWPGFWDEVDVYNYQLAPLFTVAFLKLVSNSAGPALSLRQRERRWSPAELVSQYDLGQNLRAREHRSVVPGGWFLSEWLIENRGKEDLELAAVIWSSQPADELDLSSVRADAGSVSWCRRLVDRCGECLEVETSLEAPNVPIAGSAVLSERSALQPRWEFSPFPEKWRHGFGHQIQLSGISSSGLLYTAAASRLSVRAGGTSCVTLQARVVPLGLDDLTATGVLAEHVYAHSPPPASREFGCPEQADDPGKASRRAWREAFDAIPALACSDPFIERYWYYRWYGLRLCGHEGGIGNHLYPGCCEGTGYFHSPITYSAQCHARELRWLRNPDRARGVILNFLAHQKESGQLHGRIYVNHLERTDFYFADWGEAVLAVDTVHPDLEFLRAVYKPLVHYAEWLDRERDAGETGLVDIVDHFETGQEFMSRYMAVSSSADSESWGSLIRLKGIDATVYAWSLQRSLAVIAGRLHDFGEAARWIAAADRTADAISRLMWDEDTGMFSDVDPETLQRTGVKAAVCFYPYFTDLVTREHVDGLRRHLLNSAEFWTAYPVPSTSADDLLYSPDAEWKGKRHNCPWNGRVWPMANSHVAEALASAAIAHDASLRPIAASFIRKFIYMMFHDGDSKRPRTATSTTIRTLGRHRSIAGSMTISIRGSTI
jgi:hypothetical protein